MLSRLAAYDEGRDEVGRVASHQPLAEVSHSRKLHLRCSLLILLKPMICLVRSCICCKIFFFNYVCGEILSLHTHGKVLLVSH